MRCREETEEKERGEELLVKLIENSLSSREISSQEAARLTEKEALILGLFIMKKYKMSVDFSQKRNIIFPQHIKTKRNEEILKFVLKGFFKYLCKRESKGFKGNYFSRKKEISARILEEIMQTMQMDRESFMSQNFIDKNKLIIRGNKKILLYNHSSTFRMHINTYLNHVFVQQYQEKRIDKISTILQNVQAKFFQSNSFEVKQFKHFFLKNSKLKLPWSDLELINARLYCRDTFNCLEN